MAAASVLRTLSPAAALVFLMGLVSLFSNIVVEGAYGLQGAYLSLLGASATAVGVLSGIGAVLAIGIRWWAGWLADRTGRYWLIVIAGTIVNLAAISLLAFVGEKGLWIAFGLILAGRLGGSARKTAKNTILSFAAEGKGSGMAYAFQEFLEQIGAVLGPMLLWCILWLSNGDSQFEEYAWCYASLAVPSAIALAVLFYARRKIPFPERIACADKPTEGAQAGAKKKAWLLFVCSAGLFTFGMVEYPIITMHAQRAGVFSISALPLLYGGAMLADAFAGLAFGWLFDRYGMRVIAASVLITAPSSLLIFCTGASVTGIALGVLVWGIGVGAGETIFMAAIVQLTEKKKRGTGFGTYESALNVCRFFECVLMGVLYDCNPCAMACVAAASQLAAVPLCWKAWKASRGC